MTYQNDANAKWICFLVTEKKRTKPKQLEVALTSAVCQKIDLYIPIILLTVQKSGRKPPRNAYKHWEINGIFTTSTGDPRISEPSTVAHHLGAWATKLNKKSKHLLVKLDVLCFWPSTPKQHKIKKCLFNQLETLTYVPGSEVALYGEWSSHFQ